MLYDLKKQDKIVASFIIFILVYGFATVIIDLSAIIAEPGINTFLSHC